MANFSDLVVKLELQQAAFNKGMDDAAKRMARVQQSARQAQSGLASLENGMKGVAQAAAAAGAAFGTFKGVQAITKAADEVRNLQGSFTALLGSSERASDMMLRVFNVIDRTGAPLEAVAGATQRLAIAMTAMGASNAQIETLAETFIKLGKVGGASAAETAAGLQQLGQALASGKLGGDELKSIRENAPLVAEAIAQGMGVTTGKLKELGEQGKLTSDVVGNALIAAADKANAAFAKLPQSLEQATNKMLAQATLAAAEFDKIGGTTTTLVTTVNYVTESLKRWTAELAETNARLNTTQILVEFVNDILKLAAVAAVALSAAFEIVGKRIAFIADQLDLLVNLDFTGVMESSRRWREELERIEATASRTIETLMNPPKAPFGKVIGGSEETGGQPLVPGKPLKPGAGGGGGGANKEADALKKRGEALAAQVNAQNALNQKLAEYKELLEKGAISEVTYARAVEEANRQRWAANDAMRAALDPIFEYNKRIEELDRLLQQNVITLETWRLAYDDANKKLTESTKRKDNEKTPIEKLEESALQAIGGGIGDFFTEIITGSKTAEQAFAAMVQKIITDLARLLAEFAAAEAAKFIIKSLFGGTPAAGGKAAPAPASLMLASRPPAWSAAASLGVTPFATPAAGGEAVGAAAGTSGGPWQVNVHNNAPGVDVTTAQRSDGGLDIMVNRVRSMLAQDVVRGGNAFSRSLESAYSLGRGR